MVRDYVETKPTRPRVNKIIQPNRNWDSDSTRAQFDQLRQVPPLDPGFLLEMQRHAWGGNCE